MTLYSDRWLVRLILMGLAFGASLAPLSSRCLARQNAGVALPQMLPFSTGDWSSSPPGDRPIYVAALALPPESIQQLLVSESGAEVGLGIFVLNYCGDTEALWSLRHLLEDTRPTLPQAVGVSHDFPGRSPSFTGAPQTVGGYLRGLYHWWFGVLYAPNAAELEAALPDAQSRAALVQPWIVRLRRASYVEEDVRWKGIPHPVGGCSQSLAEVKQSVRALPPEYRWVVVSLAIQESKDLYSDQEAAQLLAEAAVELGGRIDPDASPAWTQPGMTHQKGVAVGVLRRLAPNVVAPQE